MGLGIERLACDGNHIVQHDNHHRRLDRVLLGTKTVDWIVLGVKTMLGLPDVRLWHGRHLFHFPPSQKSKQRQERGFEQTGQRMHSPFQFGWQWIALSGAHITRETFARECEERRSLSSRGICEVHHNLM